MANMNTITKATRMVTKRPFRVSIEGNIGSGKSTCIQYFDKYPNVDKHGEPLHEWRNVCGHNLLGLMYSDKQKWSFPFQHYVHLSRLKIQTSAPSHPNTTVKMFERSVQNSRYCFVENAKRQGCLEDPEYQTMQAWFDYTEKCFDISLDLIENAKRQGCLEDPEYQTMQAWFDYTEKCFDISLDLIVYLKTTPEVVFERMMQRGRAEESEVPLAYLQEIHDSYERWFNSPDVGCEVLTIDADRGLACVKEDLERYSYKILGGNHTN